MVVVEVAWGGESWAELQSESRGVTRAKAAVLTTRRQNASCLLYLVACAFVLANREQISI